MIKTQTKSVAKKMKPSIIRPKTRPAITEDGFPDFSNGAEFDALSDADKEKVALYYEQGRHLKEMRPLTIKERAEVRRMQKQMQGQMGRPRIGKGAKVISLSVERDLLARADAYAREHGMKRAEMVAKGLVVLMGDRRR